MSEETLFINQTCETDLDCQPYLTNRLCFANTPFVRPGEPECLCGGFYQWEGLNCDEYGIGTWISIVIFGSIAVGSAFFVVLNVVEIVRRMRKSENGWLKNNAANTTLVFSSLAFVGTFLWGLFTMLNFAVVSGTPPDFMVSDVDGLDDFGRYEWVTRNIAHPLGGIFTTLTQLNVCLMWIEVGQRVQRMAVSKKTHGNLEWSRRIVIIFEVLFILCFVAGLLAYVMFSSSVLLVLTVPFVVFLLVMYAWGALKMTAALHPMTIDDGVAIDTAGTCSTAMSNDNTYMVMLRAIRRTTVMVIICDSTYVLFSVAYYFNSANNGAEPHQWLNAKRIAHHGILLPVFLSVVAVQRYLMKSASASTQATRSVSADKLSHDGRLTSVTNPDFRHSSLVRVDDSKNRPKWSVDKLQLELEL